MERMSAYQKGCVVLLVSFWAVCFGMSLHRIPNPGGLPTVYVDTPATDAHPVVVEITSKASKSGIEQGDRLLQLGGKDLRGVTRLGYLVRFVEAANSNPTVHVLCERGGVPYESQIPVDSMAITRYLLPASFMFAVVAVLLLWRGRPTPQIHAFFLAFMTTATYLSANFFGSRSETYAAVTLHGVLLMVLPPLMCRAFLLFPYDEPQTNWRWRFGPWILAALGPLHLSRYGLGLPRAIGVPAVVIGTAAFFTVVLAIMTRNYRLADRIGRRQIRWVILGTYLSALPAITAGTLTLFHAKLMDLYIVSLSAIGLLPLSILISIMRFNLFDIDRLISLTATYNILIVGAVAIGIVVIPWTAETLLSILGLNPTIGQLLVAVTLGLLVVTAQPRLRRWIERVFFAERYALDRGFEGLQRELSRCQSPSDLISRLGQSLTQLIRPEPCVIFGRDAHTFTPIYAQGQAVPPALPANTRLAQELEHASTPIALGASTRWHKTRHFNDFDDAALLALNAALLAPLNQSGRLVGMICLGPKRSGDVYPPNDARLIGAVADRVSAQLDRFDRAELLQEAKVIQESLRRYVPGAVVDQLARGSDVESGEREVSVLFVDIRGYTSYAENLRPAEIFYTINRYTETVSGLIRKQGGNVVEFNGDGMMAVFGAPNPLDDKEARAVRAARDIVNAMGELPTHSDRGEPLSVGVGIATGPAFVGNIRAADRFIWTAIGNTTNLAARLQSLTRQLDAAIVIDKHTREAAGIHAEEFTLRPDLPVRGRRQVPDIYALPIKKPA